MTRNNRPGRPPTSKARTRRASAGAGLLLVGALLTGCGAEPGDIPLSEIRPESATATPTFPGMPGVSLTDPVSAATAAPASTAHNGQIVSRAFVDDARTSSAIVALAPDGSGERQVTQPPEHFLDDRPDWSPDGATIAFDRTDSRTGASRLWTVAATGEAAHEIGRLCDGGTADCANEDERSPSYSPDGKQLAFSRSWGALDQAANNQIQYSDLYLMRPDGTDVQRLTFLTNDKPYSGTVSSPSWSPDGKHLAFEYHTSASGQPANSRAIFVVDANGTNLRQLTPWGLRAGERTSWSPDGGQILFTTYPTDVDYAPGGGIYSVHPDGTAIIALTPAPSDTYYGTAAFAPDGKSVVFVQAPTGAGADLYTMHPDGTSVARLTNIGEKWLSRPAWGTAPVAVQAVAQASPSAAPTDAASPSASPSAAATEAPAQAAGQPQGQAGSDN